MADTTITVDETESDLESRRINVIQNTQSNGTLITHSHSPQHSNDTVSLGFNFNTMERSRRIIANNISSRIGDMNPFLNLSRSRPALSLREWFNPYRQRQVRTSINEDSDSIVINIDSQPSESAIETLQTSNDNHQHHTFTDSFSNSIRESVSSGNQNNNNNTEGNSSHTIGLGAETRALHKRFENYVTFLAIVLTKFLYDNGAELLNFVLLFATFLQANSDLKREILKQQNRSRLALFGILCYIIICFVFINYIFKDPIFFTYTPPVNFSQLVWTVAVTDYVLKLITVGVKVLLTSLPVKIVAFERRGNYYLMVEAASQLYCCGAPLKPWLQYLYLMYESSDKNLGIIISSIYAIQKGGDIILHIKFFFDAAWKMLQNVSLGMSPSMEQIIASGGICAICHEQYSKPVRLHCKHIFCEDCVTMWLDRERSCPLCRAFITDDPIYRDGHTSYFVRLY